ncbi:TPA: hypothetical protein ACSTLS_001764 [Serratia fonticola]
MSTGLVISVPGVDWSNKNLGIMLAVPDGAEYIAKYNSANDLTRNLVPGKPAATVTGAPIIQSGGGAAFNRNVNYLSLGLLPSNWSSYTLIAIARAPAAATNARWCTMVGNWGANSVQGGGGFLALESTTSDFRLRARSSTSPLIQPTFSGLHPGTLFTAGMVATASHTDGYRILNSEVSKISAVSTSVGWGDKPLYVGHAPGEVNTVEIVIHACAVYSRALDQSEFEAVSKQLMALARL